MKKSNLEILSVLDSLAQSEDLSLHRPEDHPKLLKAIESKFKSFEKPGIEFFGLRTQLMFAYVVNSLHSTIAINEEDAGPFFSEYEEIRRPDFRVKTAAKEFFVEVKNVYENNINASFEVSRDYLNKLSKYAKIFGLSLFIGVYWGRMRVWTMVPAKAFSGTGEKHVIRFSEAMKQNHMYLVGDAMLGIVPPIGLRLYFDQARTSEIGKDGESKVTVEEVKMFSGNSEIKDESSSDLLWCLLQYGDWNEVAKPAAIKGNKLVSMDFEVFPLERVNPTQEFEIVGFLSSVLSREYNDLTTGGKANNLLSVTPSRALYRLGKAVDNTMKIGDLRVWKFNQTPTRSCTPPP